jgi:trehalose 6-phosphate synthase
MLPPERSRGLWLGLLIAGIVGGATLLVACWQMYRERLIDLEDQERRAHLLAHQIEDRVLPAVSQPHTEAVAVLAPLLEGYRKMLGFAVYLPDGRQLAAGKDVGEWGRELQPAVTQVLAGKAEAVELARGSDLALHILARRLIDDEGRTAGALVVVHDITHLDDRANTRLLYFAIWTLVSTLALVVLVVGATWYSYELPLRNLAEWMRRVRTEAADEAPPVNLPVALLANESARLAASFQAARQSALVESRSVVREHKVWTRERLRAHAIDCLRGGQLVVVSNREPYMHQFQNGTPQLIVPAGGLVTALDPVLQVVGGLWVAHGAGDADRQTADAQGRLRVPPATGAYTLRRVWLTKEEEQGYYYGLSNEGLWALCHLAHERPVFRATDWQHYVDANRRFTNAILEDIGSGSATVLVQDYHLALVPQMLKDARPDLRVGIFWHIPWPNPEAFRICPWRTELLKGMLGADLIGFHLQQYCNNFLDTVDRMVEARLDWDDFAVELGGRQSLVRPFPISIENWAERGTVTGPGLTQQINKLRTLHKLGAGQVVVGVDRIDYTKGLPERFRAIERFLEKYPQQHGQVTFVQLGAPSRTHIPRYRELIVELETLADKINWRFQTDDWKPMRFLVDHHSGPTVHAFMALSSVCLVSSLHDGMNLVAKEYVAAKTDCAGVLVLSEFAGAARELPDALIINPYDIEQFANAIAQALTMPPAERTARMERMRQVVEERNVYWWAAAFLADLCGTRANLSRTSGQFSAAQPLELSR